MGRPSACPCPFLIPLPQPLPEAGRGGGSWFLFSPFPSSEGGWGVRLDPLAIADIAAPLESLAAARHGPTLRRLVLSDPEALLAFLEAETDKVRRHLTARREADDEKLRDLKLRGLAELAAGAAHEINNPLAVISGLAQHLLKTEESLERAKALERIIAQCKRVHGVLTDLMFFARPPEPKPRLVNLGRLLAEMVTSVARQAGERRVSVDLDSLTPKLSLHADPEQLAKAIGCLVTNAVEAAPADGWVRISAGLDAAGNIEIHVADSGPGLTPVEREHLFDPFFSGRSAGRGMGLGLSKVWRIALLHGGKVHFSSDPGQPTRFTLSLPAGAIRNGKHSPASRTNGKLQRNGKLPHRRK
jgi:two-component system, NtrC family, sensor kinase